MKEGEADDAAVAGNGNGAVKKGSVITRGMHLQLEVTGPAGVRAEPMDLDLGDKSALRTHAELAAAFLTCRRVGDAVTMKGHLYRAVSASVPPRASS